MSRPWLLACLFLLACGGPPNCPVATPGAGAACEARAFVCESGGGSHQRCSTLATCSNAIEPSWQLTPPADSCTRQNGPSCAVSFNNVPTATACTSAGELCDYPEGRCECVPCAPEGLNWRCRTWTSGLDARCPDERPQIGSACTEASILCRYDDACTVSFGPDLICLNERWQPRSGARRSCAVPACGID